MPDVEREVRHDETGDPAIEMCFPRLRRAARFDGTKKPEMLSAIGSDTDRGWLRVPVEQCCGQCWCWGRYLQKLHAQDGTRGRRQRRETDGATELRGSNRPLGYWGAAPGGQAFRRCKSAAAAQIAGSGEPVNQGVGTLCCPPHCRCETTLRPTLPGRSRSHCRAAAVKGMPINSNFRTAFSNFRTAAI